jgi:hypothetical protein
MGQRINFYKNNVGKSLRTVLNENFINFKKWYVERNQKSLIEFNEQYGSTELLSFLHETTLTTLNFENIDNRILGELTIEFIWDYLGNIYSPIDILECLGPDLKVWRYVKSRSLILETNNLDFLSLWDNLFKGRSLLKTEKFERFSEDSLVVGFLSFDEQVKLMDYINNYFGTLEQIRQKYWTAEDFDIFNHRKSVSYHSPISEGLEITIEMLEKVKDNKNEIITTVE